MANATLKDYRLLISAGINPLTGKPIRCDGIDIKTEVKKVLRIVDEQDAVSRYVTNNIPVELALNSQDIERQIYYRGDQVLFKYIDKYYLMPYALCKTIDVYGRYNYVTPVPIANDGSLDEIFGSLQLKVVYKEDDPIIEEYKANGREDELCVIVRDYTPQLAEKSIARQLLNDGIIDCEADCIPYMKTNLLMATGISGLRVNDPDQAQAVALASQQVKDSAMQGQPWIPIVGNLEWQEIANASVGKSEEFMLAMQSLDNFRLSLYGIPEGGLFEKKAHTLESEQSINGSSDTLPLFDGLKCRERAYNIFNKIFGTNITVQINPDMVQAQEQEMDMEGDSQDGNNVEYKEV